MADELNDEGTAEDARGDEAPEDNGRMADESNDEGTAEDARGEEGRTEETDDARAEEGRIEDTEDARGDDGRMEETAADEGWADDAGSDALRIDDARGEEGPCDDAATDAGADLGLLAEGWLAGGVADLGIELLRRLVATGTELLPLAPPDERMLEPASPALD